MAHLLVLGASGISGWAVAKEALSYPSKSAFAQVTALTNRPLSIEKSKLPADKRLELVSGINLLESPEVIAQSLKSKLKQADNISHVVYTAFVQPGTGSDALVEQNTRLLQNAVKGVLLVTNKLQSVILQSGGMGYGLSFSDKLEIKAPLKETHPRIPKPYYDSIFYYTQYDTLAELSKGANWTFTEVRPDVIVGFVPGTNAMNCAQGLAFYLTLYRAVYGEGATVPFPGSEGGWTCKHTDTSQDILAKFEIYAALHPDVCGNGNAFNVADGAVVTWEDKWPGICSYFGLKGEGPSKQGSLREFIRKHATIWDELVRTHGLDAGRFEKYDWDFFLFVTDTFKVDRQYDLSAARKAGFTETVNTVDGYLLAFDRFRDAKLIP